MSIGYGKKQGVITVTPDCILRTKRRLRLIGRRVQDLMSSTGLSRRAFADWMADRIYLYEGSICLPDGQPFEVTDTLIDDVFNGDGSFRYLSTLTGYAKVEPAQRPQWRVVRRLRVIDLAFRLHDSEQQPSMAA